MKIIINKLNGSYLETISFDNFDNIHETFKKLSSIKGPLEAIIFAINEPINSHYLLKFKNNFDEINICSLCIYSNNRDTILAGKSLKIKSTFVKEQEAKNKLLFLKSKKRTIFFTKEQLDLETEYLQMETFALLETLIQEPLFPQRKIFMFGANC